MRRILTMAFALSSALAANFTTAVAPAAAAEQNRVCKVENVAAFTNRVHVRCDAVAGGGLIVPPVFFSVEVSSPLADKLLILGAAAIETNRPLHLTYEGLPGQNNPGCQVSDCRRLLSVWLMK